METGNANESTSEMIIQGTIDPSNVTNFSLAQKTAQSVTQNEKKYSKIEFVLPFTREIFQNREEQEKLNETVTSIRKGLPACHRDNITILKTSVNKKSGKKLHAIRILGPIEMEQSMLKLKMTGINVRNKHLNAWGPRERNPNAFPREVSLQFRNLPHFIPDEMVLDAIQLPSTENVNPIVKQRLPNEDGGAVFTGWAYTKLIVENDMQLEQLKTWANEKCTETFAIDEMEFYANIPSILECEHCKTTGKRFNGHHVKYCWELKIAAQQQHEDAENSPTPIPQEINQESSQPPLPEKRNKDGKKEKLHKSLKTQNIVTKQLNQPVQNMQNDLETTKWIANTEKMIDGSENSNLVSLGRVLRNRQQHRKAETDQNSDKRRKPILMKINIITWNSCGLDKGIKLNSFLQKNYPQTLTNDFNIFCFQEVKLEELDSDIILILEYYNLSYHYHPSIGRSGGLLTCWNLDAKVQKLYTCDACLVTHFTDFSITTVNTFINATDYPIYCQQLRNAMQCLKSFPDHQTVLLGDLNAYQNAKKDRVGQKKEGTVKKDLHLCIFRKLKFIFDDFQLDDLALTLDCDTVTHECKRTNTKTRIDYFFLNDFSNVEKIETSENNLSDHYWVKLKLATGTEIEISPGSWRLNNNILIPNYKLIRNFLGMSDVNQKNCDMEKQKLRDYLRGLCLKQKSLENQRKQKVTEFLSNCDPADPNYGFYSKVLRGIEIKECKELLSKTKNHMKEVFEGNPNSVKRWVKGFQPRTLINELKCSNVEMSKSSSSILDDITEYYEDLYQNDQVEPLDRFLILRFFSKAITDDEKDKLSLPFSVNEIEQAIDKLNLSTRPGPDGLTSELYRQHKHLFANLLCPIFQRTLEGKSLPYSFHCAILKLLPKEKGVKTASDFRPTSLINTDQKIFSHLIATRFKDAIK